MSDNSYNEDIIHDKIQELEREIKELKEENGKINELLENLILARPHDPKDPLLDYLTSLLYNWPLEYKIINNTELDLHDVLTCKIIMFFKNLPWGLKENCKQIRIETKLSGDMSDYRLVFVDENRFIYSQECPKYINDFQLVYT